MWVPDVPVAAFKAVSVAFALVGLGLVGCGALRLLDSYYALHDPESVRVAGEFLRYDAETHELVHAGGHVETMVWFAQPVFRFRNEAGRWLEEKDSSCHPYRWLEPGERVDVIVPRFGYAADRGPAPSFAKLADPYTRYLYHGLVTLLGLVFLAAGVCGLLAFWGTTGTLAATVRAAD